MTELKLVELVQKLEKKTSAGELKWEKTANSDEFQTTLATFVIHVSRAISDYAPDSFDFNITLVTSDGVSLDTITDSELSNIIKKSGLTSENAYLMMTSIFANAKRKALGVDKAIDDVLKELGD